MAIYPGIENKKKPEMVQLSGDSGKVEAPVHGDQRIYSRKDTQKLVTMAASAASTLDYLKLGRFAYEATKAQDARPAEYTEG